MIPRYFAYGSNMNPQRVRDRGLAVVRCQSAGLAGYRLVFDKHSTRHAGMGHANLCYDPGGHVEGVLYWLAGEEELRKMDPFEGAPVNYSREIVQVTTADGGVAAWTYFANPAVRRAGLKPPRAYLAHLLAGEAYLSAEYYQRLLAAPCADDPA